LEKAKNDQHTYYVYKEVTSADRARREVTTAGEQNVVQMCRTGAAGELSMRGGKIYILFVSDTPRRSVFFLFVLFGTHKSLDAQQKHNA
jgi:hypothetical protein